MPRYDYRCNACGSLREGVRSIADRRDGPLCCESTMELVIISPVGFRAPLWNMNYYDPATGQHITSERQRRQLHREKGLIDAREFPAPDFEAMADERRQVHESANAPLPRELTDAMKRQGLDNVL